MKKHKKSKPSKFSKTDAADLAKAVQFAFGHDGVDEFFDEVLRVVPFYQKLFAERGEQSRTE